MSFFNTRDTDKLKAQKALEFFYKNQNLDFATTTQNINFYPLWFIKVPFPNIPARKKLLYLHDLNHVMFGYSTDLRGEAGLAAFELGSGFPKGFRVGYLYSPFALLPGLLLCPISVFQSFRRGFKSKNSCHLKMSKDQILATKVGVLKEKLKSEKV